jgi:hypothetical protein
MKTVKFISVLSLALILLGTTSVYAKQKDYPKAIGSVMSVKYEVKVHFSSDNPVCNLYQVQLLDANGRPVAPPQAFIQGKETYTFYEVIRATDGVRIARMILTPNVDHFVCNQELFTPPVVKAIHFNNHQTYIFDLFPIGNRSTTTE